MFPPRTVADVVRLLLVSRFRRVPSRGRFLPVGGLTYPRGEGRVHRSAGCVVLLGFDEADAIGAAPGDAAPRRQPNDEHGRLRRNRLLEHHPIGL